MHSSNAVLAAALGCMVLFAPTNPPAFAAPSPPKAPAKAHESGAVLPQKTVEDPAPDAAAIRARTSSTKPGSGRAAPTRVTPRRLVIPPIAELPPTTAERVSVEPWHNTYRLPVQVPIDGFQTGDFYIQPQITMATDCRYGDPRTRERALIDVISAQDAQRLSEVPDNPLVTLLRPPNKDDPKPDPGFQIASTINQRLRPPLSVTAPLRALEEERNKDHAKRPEPGSRPDDKPELRRSIATVRAPRSEALPAHKPAAPVRTPSR